MLLITYLFLPLFYVLFSLAYLIVGSALYVLGPLVLGLYPSGTLGEYARAYLKNLVTWGLWPVLYALFSALMVSIHFASVQDILKANSFLGGFLGVPTAFLLGIASAVFAIAILVIPLISHHIINGSIGNAVATVASTVSRAVRVKFNGGGGGK